MENEKVDVRDFDDSEIADINNYVSTQIPQSELGTMLIINENPEKKIKIFIQVYRILTGVSDFLENGSTKIKLKKYTRPYKEIYDHLYPLLVDYESIDFELIKNNIRRKINREVLIYNEQLNKIINDFLVFAERQQLFSTSQVSGLNMEKPSGLDIMNKLSKTL